MKIIHIITGLGMGGAEMMLYKLLAHTDRAEFAPEVISLTDIGIVGAKIQELHIPVHALGCNSGSVSLSALMLLSRMLKKLQPAVVQTWMYHADLLGGLIARRNGITALAWGIRQTNLSPALNKRATLMIARLCACLSRRVPKKIVCCSEEAKQSHQAFGYSGKTMVVIPNGFDLELFRPDTYARQKIRQELGFSEDVPLIGLVARFDPQKDHRTFVQAAARLVSKLPEAHFILCGNGIDASNAVLAQWIAQHNLSSHFRLLGSRADIPAISAAMDIITQSSRGEGFPNVIGEAMACGTLCVATDVGATALLVGDTGRIVPPGNPDALACAWYDVLRLDSMQRMELGLAARRRVEENFSMDAIALRYGELYKEMACPCAD